MRVIAYFEDKSGMMEHRAQHEPAHLDYLERHQKEIPVAGGLRPELNGVFVGGLWVMEVESFERAEELVKNDPYYAPELRSYKLFVWGKAHERDKLGQINWDRFRKIEVDRGRAIWTTLETALPFHPRLIQ